MTLATTYSAGLCLAIFSLLCLGSWANSLKLAGRWRFELFYFDFSFGLVATSLVLAFTAGSLGYDSFTFMDDVMRASKHSLVYAFGAGMIFNLGNLLLVAGMSLVGMSIAFLIALGIAIVVGALVAQSVGSPGNPGVLFTGAAVVLAAVFVCAFGYRSLARLRELEKMKAGAHRTLRMSVSWKGVLLSVGGGIVLGSFTPLLDMARNPDIGLGPYSLGVLILPGDCVLHDPLQHVLHELAGERRSAGNPGLLPGHLPAAPLRSPGRSGLVAGGNRGFGRIEQPEGDHARSGPVLRVSAKFAPAGCNVGSGCLEGVARRGRQSDCPAGVVALLACRGAHHAGRCVQLAGAQVRD
jgi:hypothetical protein